MIRQIRPYELFTLVEAGGSERVARVKIPHRRDLKSLETMLLISVAQLLKARRIFEFGTFLGSTTLNLAMNAPADAEIFTLDLERPEDLASIHPNDAMLADLHIQAPQMDFAGTPTAGKIHQLTGNSLSFDFCPWAGSIDLSFIDGGHDTATLEADTRNAVQMARQDKPAAILWHDYGNPAYPELTAWLGALPMDLIHIGDTMLCLWLNGAAQGILPGLAVAA